MICPVCNKETYRLVTKYVDGEMASGCLNCLGNPPTPRNSTRKQHIAIGGEELYISPAHLEDIRSRTVGPEGEILRGGEARKYREYRDGLHTKE